MTSTWLPSFNENCCEVLYAIIHQQNNKVSQQIKLQKVTEGLENLTFKRLVLDSSSFTLLQLRPLHLATQNISELHSLNYLANRAMVILNTPLKNICEGVTQLEKGKQNFGSEVQSAWKTERSLSQKKWRSKAFGITRGSSLKSLLVRIFMSQLPCCVSKFLQLDTDFL